MRAYRYLKNAERWVTVIGLFFLGATFVSQTLWLTKVSIVVCGLMFFSRLLLKWKMRSLYRKSPQKRASHIDENDYEYVFRWAVVTWTLFVVTMMIAGFLFSIDVMGLEGLDRTILGLAIYIGIYTLSVSIRYWRDTKKEKMSGRHEITAADFNKSHENPKAGSRSETKGEK